MAVAGPCKAPAGICSICWNGRIIALHEAVIRVMFQEDRTKQQDRLAAMAAPQAAKRARRAKFRVFDGGAK
jgi:hypothetical protein